MRSGDKDILLLRGGGIVGGISGMLRSAGER